MIDHPMYSWMTVIIIIIIIIIQDNTLKSHQLVAPIIVAFLSHVPRQDQFLRGNDANDSKDSKALKFLEARHVVRLPKPNSWCDWIFNLYVGSNMLKLIIPIHLGSRFLMRPIWEHPGSMQKGPQKILKVDSRKAATSESIAPFAFGVQKLPDFRWMWPFQWIELRDILQEVMGLYHQI